MSAGAQIDYSALAKQAGALDSQPAPSVTRVDYAALAKQSGSTDYQAPRSSSGQGFWSHVEQSISSMIPSPEEALKSAAKTAILGPAAPVISGLQSILGAKEEYSAAKERGHGTPYSAAAGVSTLVGVSPERMEAAAAKGDTAGVLGEAAVPAAMAVAPIAGAKIAPALPDVLRGGWRKIGNPMGLASTGQELLTQGISPRASMQNFGPALEKAAGDLKAFDAESPIKSVHDLNDAIPEIKQKIWSEEVEPALQRQATKSVNMKPVADAVRGQISDEMRDFDEGNAAKLETLATKLENARDVTSANKLLKYVNGQLESYFQKFPAARKANLMNNPETAGWEAARSELRNQFLSTLEDAGESDVRDARLRYGAMDTLQDAVERRVNVADRAKPMSLGRIVGLAGAVPTGGLSVLAGEISNYLNKPDVLIRRGIKKLPED